MDLLACNLDQGQPGFPATVLPEFLTRMDVPHRIEYQDTYSIVIEDRPGGTMCCLCSRLRRGNLYRIAREEGCSAVVLGHHRDDILETFFMNLFHGGRLATMPPKLLNEDGDLFVYRPLAFVAEADCDRFAAAMGYPIIPCDLCGSQEGLQRVQVKKLLDDWEVRTPGRRQVMFRALMNVRPSHLVDPELFDFRRPARGQPCGTIVKIHATSAVGLRKPSTLSALACAGRGPPVPAALRRGRAMPLLQAPVQPADPPGSLGASARISGFPAGHHAVRASGWAANGCLLLLALGLPLLFAVTGAFRRPAAALRPAAVRTGLRIGRAIVRRWTIPADAARIRAQHGLSGGAVRRSGQLLDRHGRAAQAEVLARCEDRICGVLRMGDLMAPLQGGNFARGPDAGAAAGSGNAWSSWPRACKRR